MARSIINGLVALNLYEILKSTSYLMCCRCANHLCSAFGQDMAHMHAISLSYARTDIIAFFLMHLDMAFTSVEKCHAGSLAFIQFLKAYIFCLHVLFMNNLNVFSSETRRLVRNVR